MNDRIKRRDEVMEAMKSLHDLHELHPEWNEKDREIGVNERRIKQLFEEAVKLYYLPGEDNNAPVAAQRLGTAEAIYDSMNRRGDFLGVFSNFGHHWASDFHTERGVCDRIINSLRSELKEEFDANWQKGRKIIEQEEETKHQIKIEKELATPKPTPQQEYDGEIELYLKTKAHAEDISRTGANAIMSQVKDDLTAAKIEPRLVALKMARLEIRCQREFSRAYTYRYTKSMDGAVIGGLLGLIGGPIGLVIGAAIGGGIGSGASSPSQRDQWLPVIEKVQAFRRTLPPFP